MANIPSPTIEQELASAGYGHRRHRTSHQNGTHEIIWLATGEVVGRMTACEASEFARAKIAAAA